MKRLVSKRWMMTLLVVMGFGLSAVAQAKEITGKVCDEKEVGIPRVNIIIKGTFFGTTTDSEGNYRILVPHGTILVFTFHGMKAQEVVIETGNIFNVTMKVEEIEEDLERNNLYYIQKQPVEPDKIRLTVEVKTL